MAVSRRSVLQHSVLAAVAFAVGPFKAWSATTDNSTQNPAQSNVTAGSLTNLDRAAFTGAVGSSFQASPASGQGDSVWLQLMTVSDLPEITPPNLDAMAVQPPASSPVPVTSGYMLSFLGTMSQPLAQDTYTFASDGLGTFSLLLVPGPAGQQTYDAVINQIN